MVLDDPRTDDDAGLRTSLPPDTFRPVRRWTLDSVTHVGALRQHLLDAMSRPGSPPGRPLEDVPDRMVLVASELATNALTHGVPPTVVTLLTDGPRFLLDVADHDLSTAPVVAGDRPPGQGGFGLQIARRLAQDVGWYTTARTKHVWATFPAP
jgi:serine/threonine-protein kinase RsbW